jgi:3-oxoacyl-[acyl-carrier-protein] synthase III
MESQSVRHEQDTCEKQTAEDRLHSELGSTGVPFAIGQLQGVSFFLALQVAADIMASDERMHAALIVAAERWLPPFSRQTGTLTALGDGAAAVLVTGTCSKAPGA